MSSSEYNTNVAERRKQILAKWFEDLKASGEWINVVNKKGKLKVAPARRALAVIETGDKEAKPWNDDYFKATHWSQDMREGTETDEGFEGWVKRQLAGKPGFDAFGNPDKNSYDLEPWVHEEEMSDRTYQLIIKLAEEAKNAKAETKAMESRFNKKADENVALQERLNNAPSRGLAVTEHVNMGNTRTLRYNADIDINLSEHDLLMRCPTCSTAAIATETGTKTAAEPAQKNLFGGDDK